MDPNQATSVPQFVDVPGLEHLFAVSACGRVLRKERDTAGGYLEARELTPRHPRKNRPYKAIVIQLRGKRKKYSLGNLIKRTFRPTASGEVSEEFHPVRRTGCAAPSDSAFARVEAQGEWRTVAGYPGYFVFENGAVVGPKRKALIQKQAGRYRAVVLHGKEKRVHLLVLEAFVGPRPPGTVACHGPVGAGDNSIGNLRWDTPAANTADRVAHAKLRRYGLL